MAGHLHLFAPLGQWPRSPGLRRFSSSCVIAAIAVIISSAAIASSDPPSTSVDAAIAAMAREPVRFAAGALDAPPPDALSLAPDAWPALVSNCTAAFLNASVAAAAPATTVVRVEVPPGRAVSLRRCATSASMLHVRVVLAMGRSSAVALEAWDVAVGGVTIEGPADGNASSVVDALVVVRDGSRIVANTSTAGGRAASNNTADDVHALTVAMATSGVGGTAVSGLGIVVTEGSVVRAAHDGAGVLYASACAMRAEAAAVPGVTGPASLTVEGLRVVVTGMSSVEASTTHSGAAYDAANARRAHAATIQALPGARVTATRVVVAVLDGSTASAFGDDSSSAGGGVGVSGRERGIASGSVLTTVAESDATLIAAGPATTVRVTTKGLGYGTSAMGVAASHNATAAMTNTAVYAVGPDTTVAVHVTGSYGTGASAMGVAANSYGTAAMTNATLYAVGPNTTVAVQVTGGGYGVSALGVAANSHGTATMTSTAVYAVGPDTTVAVHVTGSYGAGASAMGVAANSHGTVAMTNTAVYAVGPDTTVAVHVTDGGYSASAMGVAANSYGTAAMTNTTVYAVGPNTTVSVHVTDGHGTGASALGVAANSHGTAAMTNTTVYAVGPNTTVAVHVTGGSLGASALGLGLFDGSSCFAAGTNNITRCPDVNVTRGSSPTDVVVFDEVALTGIAFSAPPLCVHVVPNVLPLSYVAFAIILFPHTATLVPTRTRSATTRRSGSASATPSQEATASVSRARSGTDPLSLTTRIPTSSVTAARTSVSLSVSPTATTAKTASTKRLTTRIPTSSVTAARTSVSLSVSSTATTAKTASKKRTRLLTAAPTVTAAAPATVASALPPLSIAAVNVAVAADVAATSSTTAVSIVALNPAAGTQPGKLSALRGLLDCDDAKSDSTDAGDAESPEAPTITTHPLRFAVDTAGPAERYNAGIVLGAFALLAAAGALVVGVAAPVRLLVARSTERRTGGAGCSYGDALSWCRFPGLLSVPLVVVLPGAAEAGAAALSSRVASTTAVGRGVGALGVAVCVAVPVLVACAFRLRFRRVFVWSVAGAEKKPDAAATATPGRPMTASRLAKKQLSRHVDAMVLVEDREWLAAPSRPASMVGVETDTARTHALLRHYGMFFDVYRGKAPWFLAVELFFVVATSVASGLHKTTGCSPLAWTLAVLYTGLAAAFVVIRPHAVRLDRVLYGLLSVAQAAAAVFGAAAIELAGAQGPHSAHASRARTGASFFLSAVSMSAGAVGVYELGKVVYQQVKARRAKQRAQKREAEEGRRGNGAPPLEAGLLDMDRLEALDVVVPDAAAAFEVERSAAAPQHEQPPARAGQAEPPAFEFDLDAFLAEDLHTTPAAAAAITRGGEEQRRLLMDILGGDHGLHDGMLGRADNENGGGNTDAIDTVPEAVAAHERVMIATATEALKRRDQISRTRDWQGQ